MYSGFWGYAAPQDKPMVCMTSKLYLFLFAIGLGFAEDDLPQELARTS